MLFVITVPLMRIINFREYSREYSDRVRRFHNVVREQISRANTRDILRRGCRVAVMGEIRRIHREINHGTAKTCKNVFIYSYRWYILLFFGKR